MKYKVKVKSYITFEYKQSIEVEAESEDEAHDNAMEIIDNFQKFDWIDDAVNNGNYSVDHEVEDVEEI